MNTNHSIFLGNWSPSGNFTQPATLALTNGSGVMTDGYFSTVTQVQGLDLILEVLLVQMILQVFILAAFYHLTTKVNSQ